MVNAADAHWASLKVWRDLNQDGISQSGELFSLASQGIAALKVAKTDHSVTLTNGNQIADLGGYIKTDGSEGALGEVLGMGDVNLASNPFYSEFSDHITLTDAAQGIANMQGAGRVRDLQEAASIDGSLATQVAALAAPLSRAQMWAQLDGIIDTWADTSGMPTSIQAAQSNGFTLRYMPPDIDRPPDIDMLSYGDIARLLGLPLADGGGGSGEAAVLSPAEIAYHAELLARIAHISHLIGVLERFNGTLFVTVGEDSVTEANGLVLETSNSGGSGVGCAPTASPYAFVYIYGGNVALLEKSYAQLKQSVYEGLVLQTRLKGYLDAVTLSVDANGITVANDENWRRVA